MSSYLKREKKCTWAGALLSRQELLPLSQTTQVLLPAARFRGSDTVFWPSRAHTHEHTQHRTHATTTTSPTHTKSKQNTSILVLSPLAQVKKAKYTTWDKPFSCLTAKVSKREKVVWTRHWPGFVIWYNAFLVLLKHLDSSVWEMCVLLQMWSWENRISIQKAQCYIVYVFSLSWLVIEGNTVWSQNTQREMQDAAVAFLLDLYQQK